MIIESFNGGMSGLNKQFFIAKKNENKKYIKMNF